MKFPGYQFVIFNDFDLNNTDSSHISTVKWKNSGTWGWLVKVPGTGPAPRTGPVF
jgi:hypothetical protein